MKGFSDNAFKSYPLLRSFMLGRKKKEGRPLSDTADMKMWREEFNEMKLEDHDRVLKNLGLDDEDIEEFNETVRKGGKAEDLLGVGENGRAEVEDSTVKKGKKD